MYVCICARVRECELRAAIRSGACTEEAVGTACGAGTGCGSCLDRVGDVLLEEQVGPGRAAVSDTLVASAA
jgi:bacterioferritin-associated ferredoxin